MITIHLHPDSYDCVCLSLTRDLLHDDMRIAASSLALLFELDRAAGLSEPVRDLLARAVVTRDFSTAAIDRLLRDGAAIEALIAEVGGR